MINEDAIQSNLFSKDIEEELKLIKLNVLQINQHHEEIKITELTNCQKEISELLTHILIINIFVNLCRKLKCPKYLCKHNYFFFQKLRK